MPVIECMQVMPIPPKYHVKSLGIWKELELLYAVDNQSNALQQPYGVLQRLCRHLCLGNGKLLVKCAEWTHNSGCCSLLHTFGDFFRVGVPRR